MTSATKGKPRIYKIFIFSLCGIHVLVALNKHTNETTSDCKIQIYTEFVNLLVLKSLNNQTKFR
jgi:hypothetical protein